MASWTMSHNTVEWSQVNEEADVIYCDVKAFPDIQSLIGPSTAKKLKDTCTQAFQSPPNTPVKTATLSPVVMSPILNTYGQRQLEISERNKLEPQNELFTPFLPTHIHSSRKQCIRLRSISSDHDICIERLASEDEYEEVYAASGRRAYEIPENSVLESSSEDEYRTSAIRHNKTNCCSYCFKVYLDPRCLSRHMRRDCKVFQEQQKVIEVIVGSQIKMEVAAVKEDEKEEPSSVVSGDIIDVNFLKQDDEEVEDNENIRRVTRAMFKPKPNVNSVKSEHKCHTCGRTFAQKRFLGTHQRLHKAAFKCEKCNKEFKQISRHKCKS